MMSKRITDKQRIDWLESQNYVEATSVDGKSDRRTGLLWWQWRREPLRKAIDKEIGGEDG